MAHIGIVYTAKMVQTTPSANGEWAFDRIFSDSSGLGDFWLDALKLLVGLLDNLSLIHQLILEPLNLRLEILPSFQLTLGMADLVLELASFEL